MSKITKRITKRPVLTLTMEKKNETSRIETPSQTAVMSAGMFDVEFYPGRRLVLTSFNGQTLIHIREFQTIDSQRYPTKKGACFTPGRLAMLRRSIEGIDAALHQQEVNSSCGVTVEGGVLYTMHIGAGIYASVNEKFRGVNLRRYWMPEGQLVPVPTKNGIYLPASQWKSLLTLIRQRREIAVTVNLGSK